MSCYYNNNQCVSSSNYKCKSCYVIMCVWHIYNHNHKIVCSYNGCNTIVGSADLIVTYCDHRCESHGYRGVTYDANGHILYDGR